MRWVGLHFSLDRVGPSRRWFRAKGASRQYVVSLAIVLDLSSTASCLQTEHCLNLFGQGLTLQGKYLMSKAENYLD